MPTASAKSENAVADKASTKSAAVVSTSADKPADSQMREWRDSSGKFSTQARLVSVAETKVSLLKADGKSVTVSLEQLSKADREFISKHDKILQLASK